MTSVDPELAAESPRHRPATGAPLGSPSPRDVVPFGQAVKAWFAISLQTFGGPTGQIAIMQRHLVDEHGQAGRGR